MTPVSRWLVSVAALAGLAASVGPVSAQPYGYGDDGPPPFRRGPGWDGPPRWDHWHHRRWRDEGFDRRGWRGDDGRRGRDRFGGDDGPGGRQRFRNEDARRQPGDDGLRRGGPGRGGARSFGNDDD